MNLKQIPQSGIQLRGKTILVFSLLAFIFIGVGAVKADNNQIINDPVSGSLFANISAVVIGQPFTITIIGQDDNGLSSFALYYNGIWHSHPRSISGATSGNRAWTFTENNPGTYSYCGKVAGFDPYNQSHVGRVFGLPGMEEASTSPNCVSVAVNCAEPNCNNNNQSPSVCECSSGSCCDGCHYKAATNICNYQTQNEYACPWGQKCGIGVGQRINTRYQYCSGNSAQCVGSWGNYILGGWSVSEYCSKNEVCIIGNSQCQNSSKCVVAPAAVSVPVQTTSNECNSGVGVSILGKTGASNDWVKNFTANPGENLNFLMVLTNCNDKEVQNANIKAEIPKEIVYNGNLKIDGVSASGDITSGINIDKISSGAIKTISFTGQSQTTNLIRTGSGQGNVVATITLTDGSLKSDSVKVAFASSRSTAAVSSSLFQFLVTKWYFWVLFIMVILFLIYNIFKRFFMERSK